MSTGELITEGHPGAVAKVSSALRKGAMVVLPTDTVYGLVALPSHPEAIARVFDVKQRPQGMHLAVLLAGVEQLPLVSGDRRPAVTRVVSHLWPGALTLVLPGATGLVAGLGDGDSTIGVRCPDHGFIRSLAEEVGPLAATSANIHGQPTAATAAEVLEQLPEVDLVVDGGALDESAASTVVSLAGDEPELLRRGPVEMDDLLAHWAE